MAAPEKRLFLLDTMALLYRAHFAFISRPIRTRDGRNTSALFGFANAVAELLQKQKPTHLAWTMDTRAPTARHELFPEYKAHRDEMPEELGEQIEVLPRLAAALRMPVISRDGYEADDIIGTLSRRAERDGFTTHIVSADKDLAQLVDARTFLYRPAKPGDVAQILGVAEVCDQWGIERPEQVIDILALQGDASDNIPGVPGIGGKTAQKLIEQFGSVENLLARTSELKGKQRESLEKNRELALLCKKLTTIDCDVPVDVAWDALLVHPPDADALAAFCREFEFHSLAKRLLGDAAGASPEKEAAAPSPARRAKKKADGPDLFAEEATTESASEIPIEPAPSSVPEHKTIADVAHEYRIVKTAAQRKALLEELKTAEAFCFDCETDGLDATTARLLGVAFSMRAHTGAYLVIPEGRDAARKALEEFSAAWNSDALKIGHNLKFDLRILEAHGVTPAGPFFDTLVADCLIEPDRRHGMDALAESLLGYSPIPITRLIGEKKKEQKSLAEIPLEQVAEYAAEDADVTWQLREQLSPALETRGQHQVFYDIEMPLLPALVAMEAEGVAIDTKALAEFSVFLEKEMRGLEEKIHALAGAPFNLNSPKQLGEVLFEKLGLQGVEGTKLKRTKTGQYATDEQTLSALSAQHEIVRLLLDFRALTKLKSTYVDALPLCVSPATGRVHTTFNQALTATGRLASQDPNLQNIPIRTEHGREIRKAFVPRGEEFLLLSADYSQIELRIVAAMSQDKSMLLAFEQGVDIHTATAAGIYSVAAPDVTHQMRRTAKMVNFGILYGISAFGLAQRLGIPRGEAAGIIDAYFRSFPGIRGYLDTTLEFARTRGYVQTLTGRRRYLPDIRSANAAVRAAAERTAINMPAQGTAADLIKIAMARLHREIAEKKLRSRMILQVHDELLFDLHRDEEAVLRPLVEHAMKTALPRDVLPIDLVVELGTGKNWLEAH